MLELLLFPFSIAFAFSMILTPITISFARKFKLIDDPKTHQHPAIIHKKPLPRAGGIPIFLSIIAAMILFLPDDRIFLSIIAAGGVVFSIGILHEKIYFFAYIRFSGK